MKHLRKFYESDSFKKPIDVEMDVVEFKKLYKERMVNGSGGGVDKWRIIEKELNKLINDNPTMTDDYEIYQLWNPNLHQRPDEYNVKVVKAVSEEHARVKAALQIGSFYLMNQIVFDYFISINSRNKSWICEKISSDVLNGYIGELESKVISIAKRIENLKKI